MRNMVNFVINEHWYSERKGIAADEAERVVIAAAKIINTELLEKKKEIYSHI